MAKGFLDIIGSQGVFAIFFYFLLSYMLKEQSKRDACYQENGLTSISWTQKIELFF